MSTKDTAPTPDETFFLQRRVALFGLVGCVLGLLALSISVAQGIYARSTEYVPAQIVHLIGLSAPFASWMLCRGDKQRDRSFIVRVEAFATIGCATCFHVMAAQVPPLTRPDLLAALITMQIIVTRAVVVPSTGKRTAALSTVSSLGLFVVAYQTHLGFRAVGSSLGTLSELMASALTWTVLGVALATVTSSVIYGLRRAVRRAQELGQYTLLEKLGEGGMGQVFRARHAMLRRPTAVKLLHTASPEDLARFEREVQLTAQLTHPNTVTVFDYGRTPDGIFYYAMELLEGLDLQKVVERHGPMPPGRVIQILSQVAAALAEAHAIGLIHRDIKPANIILSVRGTAYDVAKVVDFGLVKTLDGSASAKAFAEATDEASGATREQTVGTPLYMAPETIKDPAGVDHRTDLYALGAVGYFLLTGTPVFTETSLVAILAAHLNSTPESPSDRLGKAIPSDLEKIVLECLAKTQTERPRDAIAIRDRLLGCVDATAWREEDARGWWSTAVAAPTNLANPDDRVSWSATTIAVDLGERSPRATTLTS